MRLLKLWTTPQLFRCATQHLAWACVCLSFFYQALPRLLPREEEMEGLKDG